MPPSKRKVAGKHNSEGAPQVKAARARVAEEQLYNNEWLAAWINDHDVDVDVHDYDSFAFVMGTCDFDAEMQSEMIVPTIDWRHYIQKYMAKITTASAPEDGQDVD